MYIFGEITLTLHVYGDFCYNIGAFEKMYDIINYNFFFYFLSRIKMY